AEVRKGPALWRQAKARLRADEHGDFLVVRTTDDHLIGADGSNNLTIHRSESDDAAGDFPLIAHVNLDGNGHPGAEIDKTPCPPADLKHRGGIDKHGELRAVNSLDDDLIGADRSDYRALDQRGIVGDRLAWICDERYRLCLHTVAFCDGNDRVR